MRLMAALEWASAGAVTAHSGSDVMSDLPELRNQGNILYKRDRRMEELADIGTRQACFSSAET